MNGESKNDLYRCILNNEYNEPPKAADITASEESDEEENPNLVRNAINPKQDAVAGKERIMPQTVVDLRQKFQICTVSLTSSCCYYFYS
jgi:hypothetical protein